MVMMGRSSAVRRWGAVILPVAVLLALAAAVYVQGAGGRWMFDDEYSLSGLTKVTDRASALNYVLSGTTGPSGRPLALATFLINASDWPDHPANFRYINIVIHLGNGVLVFWLMLLLMRGSFGTRACWPALTAAGLWLLSPLLASSVLSIVQRMTLLSGTFVLLGLIGYVKGRAIVPSRPLPGLAVLSLILAGTTVAATLAKESGVLLPILVGVIELSMPTDVPGDPRTRGYLRIWRSLFLLGPLVMLLVYTVAGWPNTMHTYQNRPFSLDERLLTEPVVLWDYLSKLLLPRTIGLGLFHDDYPIVGSASFQAWAGALGWMGLLIAAVALRRRCPWLFFGVAGFLAGHLIESSVFPLELYFEHRNYVPAVFIFGAMAAIVWRSLPSLAPALAMIFLVASGLLLTGVTTLWGRSDLAAEMWFRAHPDSPRAIQFVAQQRILSGRADAGQAVVIDAAARLPTKSDILVESLMMECDHLSGEALRARASLVTELLAKAERSYAAVQALRQVQNLIDEGECEGLSERETGRLAQAMVANPQFQADPVTMDHLYNFLAQQAWRRGAFDQAEAYQLSAYRSLPSAENALMLTVHRLTQNKTAEAIDFLRTETKRHAEHFNGWHDDWDEKVGVMLRKLEQEGGRRE